MPPVLGPCRRRRRACDPAPWRAAAPSRRRPARRSSLPRRRRNSSITTSSAGVAESAEKQASIAASASALVSAMVTPLPAASPSALITIGQLLRRHVSLGRGRIGEAGIGSCRNAGPRAEILGEALRAFELRRRLRRPEHLDALRFEIVGEACDQRRLRADDHKADLVLLAERLPPRRDRPHRAARTRRPPRSRHCPARNRACRAGGFA